MITDVHDLDSALKALDDLADKTKGLLKAFEICWKYLSSEQRTLVAMEFQKNGIYKILEDFQK